MKLRLDALAPGQTAQLEEIMLLAAQRTRLEELGLLPGTAVRCVYRAARGTIAAYAFGGAVFALRRADAEKMVVAKCE